MPPQRGRHAAPRRSPVPALSRSALLPGTLLATAGVALGGMAVLPAAASTTTSTVAAPRAQVVQPPELTSQAGLALGLARERVGSPAPSTSPTSTPSPSASATLAPIPSVAPSPPPVVASPVAPPAAAPSPSPRASKASRDRAQPEYVRPGSGRLTSRFGMRWGRLHAGIDLAAGIGSPVRAVTAGTVVAAEREGGYGNVVRLQHPDGTVTVYGHMSAILVRVGQGVGAGDQIGKEGNTGHSTGPHLHFEVRVNDVPINPLPWLTARGITV